MTEDQIDLYYKALAVCAERYSEMALRAPDLLPFLDEFKKAIEDRFPLLKLNRWLGYIQGVLIERNITSVDIERDFTRPYFRPIDFA